MRRLGYLWIILALVAAPAAAQRQREVPPPTPAQIAAARAEADALIARAQAADVFTNATDPDAGVPTLAHKASGLTCSFDPGKPANSVTINPGLPRGDDVTCHASIAELDQLQRMYKPAEAPRLDVVFRAAVAEIRAAHPDAQPAAGPMARISVPGALPTQATAMTFKDNDGKPRYLYLGMAVVRGWVIDVRMTAPAERSMEANILGEFTLINPLLPERPGRAAAPRP